MKMSQVDNQGSPILSLDALIAAGFDIQEGIVRTEEWRIVFYERLNTIVSQITKEQDPKKRRKLLCDASDVYREYRESLQMIEAYIDEINNALHMRFRLTDD